MDELDQLEAEGAARRKARREARKAAIPEEKRQAGRKARRRGRDFERRFAKYIGGKLVPLSGALDGWKGDITLAWMQIQCKHTKALAMQRRWLDEDGSDVLIQSDPGEKVADALVVMRAEKFKRLLEEAGYCEPGGA